MKDNKNTSAIIALEYNISLDGYPEEGTLILFALYNKKIMYEPVPVGYQIVFSWHGGRYKAPLRRFGTAVTAMRSYRRFITMSEEIKKGLI